VGAMAVLTKQRHVCLFLQILRNYGSKPLSRQENDLLSATIHFTPQIPETLGHKQYRLTYTQFHCLAESARWSVDNKQFSRHATSAAVVAAVETNHPLSRKSSQEDKRLL
jgi:hypothetical protein